MLNVYRAYVGDKMSFDIKEEHGILSAEVIDENTNLPPYLFIDGSLKADNKLVREFVKENVVPETRENIEQILSALGIGVYDEWEIFKVVYTQYVKGRWLNIIKLV